LTPTVAIWVQLCVSRHL